MQLFYLHAQSVNEFSITVRIMHLSIVRPTIPPGALGGDGSGFDKTSDHPLGRSGNQIPTLGVRLSFKTEENVLNLL